MSAAPLLRFADPVPTEGRNEALQQAAERRAWVRVFYGNDATGAVDHRAADTFGQLGWSWTPDLNRAVGIMGEGRQWLWRHPAFDLGRLELVVRKLRDDERFGYGVGRNEYIILHDGKKVDALRNLSHATRRLAYLTGRRFGP